MVDKAQRPKAAPAGGTGPRGRRTGLTGPPNRTDGRRPTRPDLHYHFAALLLAALTGQRPATALLGLASTEVYEKLWTLAERGTLRHGPRAPGPTVIRCRRSAPTAGVLEVSAVVHAAGRVRALAFRLEHADRRKWRCTALEIG